MHRVCWENVPSGPRKGLDLSAVLGCHGVGACITVRKQVQLFHHVYEVCLRMTSFWWGC